MASKNKKLSTFNSDPLVQILFAEAKAKGVNQTVLSETSGIPTRTFQQWTYRSQPTVKAMRKCLRAVGLDLVAVRYTKETKKK